MINDNLENAILKDVVMNNPKNSFDYVKSLIEKAYHNTFGPYEAGFVNEYAKNPSSNIEDEVINLARKENINAHQLLRDDDLIIEAAKAWFVIDDFSFAMQRTISYYVIKYPSKFSDSKSIEDLTGKILEALFLNNNKTVFSSKNGTRNYVLENLEDIKHYNMYDLIKEESSKFLKNNKFFRINELINKLNVNENYKNHLKDCLRAGDLDELSRFIHLDSFDDDSFVNEQNGRHI